MSSSKTTIPTTTSTRTTGRSSSCMSFFDRHSTPAPSPRFTICGVSATEAEINQAMKHLAARVKRSEKKLQRSARVTKQQSTITHQAREISRLRGCRNLWRRIAEIQTSQTFEVELSATVSRLKYRLEGAETSVKNLTGQRDTGCFGSRAVEDLRDERNALRVENQRMAGELERFRETEAAMGEYRHVPILLNPLVLSPVEDFQACAVARQKALMKSVMVAVEREGKRPVRAASVTIARETPRRWWNGEEGERKVPKGALTR